MPLNPAAAYQNSKVQTASGADLTLMLYEGAIKFCNIALLAIEKKDIMKANKNIDCTVHDCKYCDCSCNKCCLNCIKVGPSKKDNSNCYSFKKR